jgi:hypothetical protein
MIGVPFTRPGAMVAESGQILSRMRRGGLLRQDRRNFQKRARFIFA